MSDISMVCNCCPHRCSLSEGQTGMCGARKHTGERIESINYAHITSAALDPIEKKPLMHFHPGAKIFSIGSFGCNLFCPFCQNHSISRAKEGDIDTDLIYPDELLNIALGLRSEGNIGVAFTYNEPLVSWEYVRDCAKLLKKNGLFTVLVTNGCFLQEVLDEVLPYTDAMNIDLKCFTTSGYESLSGDLETVKTFIEKAHTLSHIELTSLIVPGLNDSIQEMKYECEWIAGISPDIPLHITRFFPCHKMRDSYPTDVLLMHRLKDEALKKLKYVHLGNV